MLAYLQVPTAIVSFMQTVSDNPIIILLMINVALLILGTFMDMSPLIVITTPICPWRRRSGWTRCTSG